MRKGLIAGAVAAVVAALAATAVVVVPAAGKPTYPSEGEVERARAAEHQAAGDVATVEARLAAIDVELDQLYIASAKAVEAYNGARLGLEQAERDERAARAKAVATAAAADRAHRDLGRLAAASYANGGGFATLGMVLEARDGEELYDGMTALRSVTESQAGVYDRAEWTKRVADEAAAEAADALAERTQAADQAREAFEAAERAVREQESAVAAIEDRRAHALAALAAARGTTVRLEEERRAGLEAEEEAERERRARDGDGNGNGPGQPPPTGDPTAPPPQPSPTATPSPTPTPTATPTATPSPTPPEPPDPPDPPSTGADAAIDYARAQVGKPYEWGADGPDTFDCSGLTMRAWEAGGVDLPHWSVAQAGAVTRVAYPDLAPGDLVFWSDNGEASGVYHVGLYIGDGKMIHAPRPGKTVEVQSVFYWVDPAFYGRV